MSDIDALIKKFAIYEPMLKEMKRSFDDYNEAKSRADADLPESAADEIDDDLRAAINAPLHDSPETIQAREAQALENAAAKAAEKDAAGDDVSDDEDDGSDADAAAADKHMRDRFEELGPDQVKQLLANGNIPAAWHTGAVLWLAEKDKSVSKEAPDASPDGQNQAAGSTAAAG